MISATGTGSASMRSPTTAASWTVASVAAAEQIRSESTWEADTDQPVELVAVVAVGAGTVTPCRASGSTVEMTRPGATL